MEKLNDSTPTHFFSSIKVGLRRAMNREFEKASSFCNLEFRGLET